MFGISGEGASKKESVWRNATNAQMKKTAPKGGLFKSKSGRMTPRRAKLIFTPSS